MLRKQTVCILLTLGLVALSPTVAGADPATSLTDFPEYQDFFKVYGEENGDHRVVLPLEPTRFFLTEKTGMRGLVELDLIDGGVKIELSGLDRKVDVYALDNAANTGILPGDEGDRLIHLARLAPSKDKAAVVRFEKALGREAFRGFELDWIFVSNAGMQPTESRLLFSTRNHFERQFTKQRLTAEGFDKSIPPRRHETADKMFGIATTPDPILVTLGMVTQQQFDGADVFFRETFEGNGRSCGTCHPQENNQTIDGPDFLDNLPPTDPLFVAEQRPPSDPISQLEVPVLMREHGLIVENIDGLDDPTVKFAMRGVPHSLSLATSTTPDDGVRTGWSGDGAPAPGTLRMFLLGATIQHYPNISLDRIPKSSVPPGYPFDFRLPTDEELDLNNEFMLSVGRLEDVDLTSFTLGSDEADKGRERFINSGCNFCHLNAGANAASPPFPPNTNANFQTNVELLPNPAQITEPTPLDATSYPFDAGFGTVPNDCDPSTLGTDGFGDCTFNSTPLIEAADTGPFFHNNTAETIEDAVRFYGGPPFPGAPIFPGNETAVRQVGAFLRVINAVFNVQISLQRNEAALKLLNTPAVSILQFLSIQANANKLLSLSIEEMDDALRVLKDGPLGNLDSTATDTIEKAMFISREAINITSINRRRAHVRESLEKLKIANGSLASGLSYDLGAGNLLF